MEDKHSFSKRNKVQTSNENPFNIYKANKPNLNNKLSDKKINKKTLATSSTTVQHKNKSSSLSNIFLKPSLSYKETINKMYTKLNKVLLSYNMPNEEINKKIINDIIFDERKRIVSIFKDYLLWYETSDFFKLYYKKNKSVKMISRFITYYESYTLFFPEYGPLEDILPTLKKNIKRKKKYLERMEEDEQNKLTNSDKKFERLIKESEIKINNSFSNSQKNSSKNTLNLDSMEKYCTHNIRKKNNGNKDLYNILKMFVDCDDKIFDKKDMSNSYNFLNKNDFNYESNLLFNSKLNRYFKDNINFNESIQNDKTKEIIKEKEKNKNVFISKNTKKKSHNINLNIFNDIMHRKLRRKSKEEQIKKTVEKGRNYKNISLRKKFINPLLKLISQSSKINKIYKYNESSSNSKYRKCNTIKYDKKTHLVKKKPQNVKTIFNSSNKFDSNNNSGGNYYILFSFRNNEINKSKQSPKSVVNNSPLFLKMKMDNMNYKKTNKKNNIFNFEKLKRINKINNLNLEKEIHRTGNNSEIDNIKDSNYLINAYNNKFKYNKFTKKLDKCFNLLKRNTITKISPIKNSKENSFKKNKNIINKYYFSNPFRIDSSLINNSSINQNAFSNSITNPNKFHQNRHKGIPSIISYNSYKEDIRNSHKADMLKKCNKNLILIKSNRSLISRKSLTNSVKKKSREISSKKSSLMKKSKNKSLIKGKIKTDITNNNKIINKMNNNIKNNILKTAIDKSISKKELKIKMKTNHNSILKACFSNINNILDKKGIFVFEDIDTTNKKNSNKKSSLLHSNENILIRNKIKKKFDLNSNKNSIKKSRICLKLPMLCDLNKI